MREPIPSEEGLFFRSLRNVAQGSRPLKAGVIALGLCIALLSDARAGDTNPPPRLLWEVKTAGGMDSFTELLPAGDKLVAMRRGVLYALDAHTGKTCWRYPLVGTAIEPYDPNYGIWGNVVLAVRGDRVIMLARHGLIEISLRNGNELREYHHGLTFPHPYLCHERPAGPLYPVWAWSADRNRIEVSVIDLDRWCESARFELDYSASFIQARGSVVYLIATRLGEPFSRIITVDLDRQTMHSMPIRCPSLYGESQVLPDGTFLLSEGRFNAACGYTGAWPHLGALRVAGDKVCIRDAFGLIRVDPRDASILWRCPVPWPRKLLQIGKSARSAIAVGNGIAAFVEDGSLYVVNAATGKLCWAIRTGAVFGRIEEEQLSRLACDEARVYLALPSGLRAFSTQPVDSKRPDPTDPGDPAYYLARGRDALRTGDFESALRALQGIGVASGLRKESRDEAAVLLSQLARSLATVLYSDLWHDVMLSEGWIAGERFAEEYTRLRSPGPLISIGTRRSLAAAAGMLDEPNLWGQIGEDAFLAGEAARILTGVCPVEKHVEEGKNPARVEFSVPTDEETFSRILPRLRARGSHLLQFYGDKLSPTQVCQLAEGDTPIARAAKFQMESIARGAGTEEKIVITRPAPPPAREEGVF